VNYSKLKIRLAFLLCNVKKDVFKRFFTVSKMLTECSVANITSLNELAKGINHRKGCEKSHTDL